MDLTPKDIISELDRYIIGQKDAKKAVAIALRNRYRRSMLPEAQREEITPKNIIMQGPTGVGKTEIARRLAKLVRAPFLKVEATKFTEVGYVGRDVESMIRDLAEVSVRMVREEKIKAVKEAAKERAYNKVIDKIYEKIKGQFPAEIGESDRRKFIRDNLENGAYDEMEISVALPDSMKNMQIAPGSGIELNIGNIFGGLAPKKTKTRTLTVRKAVKELFDVEADGMIDDDAVNAEAVVRAENEGIIFIDEIDKIAARGNTHGQDVSREGVQRDILPIVEGSSVTTKYGTIRTDFILFIAAGAFHISSVNDLIPELQGRFPINVTLESLTEEDFVEILTKPDNAVLKQYTQLLKVDNVNLVFTKDAIVEIAKIAAVDNVNNENIGARRLHTIMESLLDDISFNAGNLTEQVDVTVDKDYVLKHFERMFKTMNLKKYIL